MKTLIQGGYVVAFNGAGHEILVDGCVVYEGSRIVYAGFPGAAECPPADRVIHAPGRLISPGLINLHCIANIDLQPLRIDVGSGGFGRSRAWFESGQDIWDEEGFRTSARYSVAALLRHGSTTYCNVTTMATKRYDDPPVEPYALAEATVELGARGYVAHNYHDRSGCTGPDGARNAIHDRAAGQKGLQRAVSLIETVRGWNESRLAGFLFPYTSDSCSDDLFKESAAAARDLKVVVRSHFAQYIQETLNTLESRGLTPVARLAELGVLGPELTLTHAIYLRGHPQVGGNLQDDLQLLVDSGTSVAHCPVVFVRGGVLLHSFQRYLDGGVNLALGTDTVPPDMLGEMRMASVLSKVADQDRESGSAAAVFNAATLGGARALGRDDLGRLAPGACADIAIFNLRALHVGVVDCPIKALVHYAGGADTETVIVDGRTVVEEGRVVGICAEELLAAGDAAWNTYKAGLVERDPAASPADELYPPAFALRRQGDAPAC
ncbi:MAG: chlorohydrolase family protein [Thermaerobacterales bacterium]